MFRDGQDKGPVVVERRLWHFFAITEVIILLKLASQEPLLSVFYVLTLCLPSFHSLRRQCARSLARFTQLGYS